MEVKFLDYIVWPLWERLATVLPELQPALSTLRQNRELYAALSKPCGGVESAMPGQAGDGLESPESGVMESHDASRE